MNAKGNPDGSLSHYSSLRNFRLDRFFDSLSGQDFLSAVFVKKMKFRHFDILTGNSIHKFHIKLQTEFDRNEKNQNIFDKKAAQNVYIKSDYREITELLKPKTPTVFMQICTARLGNAQVCAGSRPPVFKSFAHSAQSSAQLCLCKHLRKRCIGRLHKPNLRR